MILINGTSKVRLQLIVNVAFAIIAIPLINFFCSLWGVEGVLLIPTAVLVVLTFVGKIQLMRIVNGTAKGIWLK